MSKKKVQINISGSVQAMKQLLKETEAANPKSWALTQQQIQSAKLKRTRLTREAEDLRAAIMEAEVHGLANQGDSTGP